VHGILPHPARPVLDARQIACAIWRANVGVLPIRRQIIRLRRKALKQKGKSDAPQRLTAYRASGHTDCLDSFISLSESYLPLNADPSSLAINATLANAKAPILRIDPE